MQLRSAYAARDWNRWRSSPGKDGRAAHAFFALGLLLILLPSFVACGTERVEAVPDSFVRISIDKPDPDRLLRSYFGGYVSPRPADPFDAGLLHERSGRLYVDMDVLSRNQPAAAEHLTDIDADGSIGWDEFESFIAESYNAVRGAPPSLEELVRETSFDPADADWMRVDVHGVMTTARRRIYVRESAIRSALEEYADRNGRLIYPIGTVFFGEHYLDDARVETTVMRKRPDGFWDYFVYDEDGLPARGTATPPRELSVPVQCVGCHYGDKVFEPEASFPARARPGPHGPRQLYVEDAYRDVEVVRYFDEHRRRSDTVLGLYGTLFVSKLRAERNAGGLDEADADLLDALEL
jgi:hypothetical protein